MANILKNSIEQMGRALISAAPINFYFAKDGYAPDGWDEFGKATGHTRVGKSFYISPILGLASGIALLRVADKM